MICFQQGDSADDMIDRVKMILGKHPGSCPVYIIIINEKGSKHVLKSKKFTIRPNALLVADLRKILGQDNVCIEG